MLENYEITNRTLAVIGQDKTTSKVIDGDLEYYIKKNIKNIIDDSCKYYGSSYIGRIEGTKKIIGQNSKPPIIVEESNELIIFPITSPRKDDCIWINLLQLKNITPNAKNAKLIFNNDKVLELEISYYSLKKQLMKATLLQTILNKRKKELK